MLIEQQSNMNRAMDGDTVAIQLFSPNKWHLIEEKKDSGYSNTQTVETRVVDEAEEFEGSGSDWESIDSDESSDGEPKSAFV